MKVRPVRVWEPTLAQLRKERAQPSEHCVTHIVLCVYKTLFDQAVQCEIIRLTKQSVFLLWVIYNELCADRF